MDHVTKMKLRLKKLKTK